MVLEKAAAAMALRAACNVSADKENTQTILPMPIVLPTPIVLLLLSPVANLTLFLSCRFAKKLVLFGANGGSTDGLAAMHSKGQISGSIKFIHIFRSN